MYPLPPREADRIEALEAAHIFDSTPDPDFDAVVTVLRNLLNVPICTISFIDSDRQWYKAKCGIDLDGTSRASAFCSHTILSDDILVVEDMRRDERFARHPFVAEDPHVRFYAGAPLLAAPGVAIGTLCAIGFKPRKMKPSEVRALKDLSQVVVGLTRGHQMRHEALELVRRSETQRRDLKIREQRFLQAERIAKIGGWEMDLATRTLHWTDETYRIFDLAVGSPIDFDLAVAAYAPHERDRLQTALDALVNSGTAYDAEYDFITGAGALKRVRTLGEVEIHEGAPKRIYGACQDVTEDHLLKKALWSAANYDSLTGLLNRNRFDDLIASGSADNTAALLLVDADHLKEVNDTLGHSAGDAMLKTLADRLRGIAGDNFSVARIGGDEFAIMVPAPVRRDELERFAKAVVEGMQPYLHYQGEELKLSVSIGVALRRDGQGLEWLRQAADLALYDAKAHCRGGYSFYRDDMKEALTAKAFAVKTVDEALIEGRIHAVYQPVFELATGRITAFETLARVKRGDALCSIGQFSDALLDRRTATRITASILKRVEEDVVAWRRAGLKVPRLAINFGPLDFQEGNIEAMIFATCERADIEPSNFAVEVTESVFVSRDADIVSETAARLRAQGIVVALDDFGTGHASLAHLDNFPVDVIKMDRTFVMRMSNGRRGQAIAASLIDLARKLGIEVIAEGVETEEQRALLAELGCQKAQGFLFCRPLPPRDIAHLLSSETRRTALEAIAV